MSSTTNVKKVPIHLQSSQNRLLIKNGMVVSDDDIQQVDIFVEDGMIKEMGNHLIIPGGTRVIDATGKFVLPGGVDASTHFQSPWRDGFTADDFYSGTKAALSGGTTTIIDCVRPDPDEKLTEAYLKWRSRADGQVCCDYALSIELGGSSRVLYSRDDLLELMTSEFGINSFVLNTGNGEWAMNDEELIAALKAIAEFGGVARLDVPENGEMVARATKRILCAGITGPEGFAAAHSEMAEEEAVSHVSMLAGQLNCPLYIGGITSGASINTLLRRRGYAIFGATTPAAVSCDAEHYFNKSWRHAAAFVSAPPLRKGQIKEICSALFDPEGGLDLISSNHATFNAEQKAVGKDNFTDIPQGYNGVAVRMAIVWSKGVHTGLMSPCKFVSITSTLPAKLFGLYPAKGVLKVGSDADIVILNPTDTITICNDSNLIKSDFNIFEGQTLNGKIEFVICRGRMMMDDGHLRAMTGFGRFITCSPYPPFTYDRVRQQESNFLSTIKPVDRSEVDININNGSNGFKIENKNAPNSRTINHLPIVTKEADLLKEEEIKVEVRDMTAPKPHSAIRICAPPGGKSSGFW